MKMYKNINVKRRALWAILFLMLSDAQHVLAQDEKSGSEGIKKADDAVREYFKSGTSLMYGIGGLLALIGAVKVYQKWNAGEPDTSKVAASWFGSCIFLVVVATVIKSFFKIS